MTNLDSIFIIRDIAFSTKVCLVKAMIFPVVMYGCESWTVKKAESWRIDAFEVWCWRRLLRVPWTARRSNQSILKEISPGISLEGMMLKLKLQYFGHLMRRVDSTEKTLMVEGLGAGGERDDPGWDGWMASLTWWTWVRVNSGSWWWTRPGVLQFMGSQRVGHDWVTELNWNMCQEVSFASQISNLCILVSWSSSFHKGLICWGILLVLVFWWQVYSTWLGIILPIPFFILRFPPGQNPTSEGCSMSLKATAKVWMEAKRESAFRRAVGKFPSQSCLENLWLGWESLTKESKELYLALKE